MDGLGDKNTVSYEKRIFAFVDILGFADLVEESERDTTKILRIYQLLDRTKSMAHLPVGHKFETLKVDLAKFRSHTFSDTVTMSCPFESFDYFNAIIAWVMRYQYLMWAEEGTFVRGAIVYGKVFDDESSSMVFGPAMVAAYRLETKRAKWPRVLVDSSMLKELSVGEGLRVKEFLRKETTGPYYLDYLRDLFALKCRDWGRRLPSPSDPIAFLKSHKTAIEKAVERIYAGSSVPNGIDKTKKPLQYCRRLVNYHNRVADRLRRVSSGLRRDSKLVRRIEFEVMIQALVRVPGVRQHLEPKPEFTPENPKYVEKYVDEWPVLGYLIHRIIADCKDVLGLLDNDPGKGRDFLCGELPKYLHELEKALDSTKIDRDKLFSK